MKVFKSDKDKNLVYESYDKLVSLWGVPTEQVDIDTTYGKTHLILTGNKNNPPLLLFHGVGDNSAVMWILNSKELSMHFYCIAVDTLGGPGKSVPSVSVNKNNFDQADWINQVVDKLQIKNFCIAGVSNGAVMAYNYALKETKKISKVVCLEGGMVINPYKAMLKMLLLAFPEILLPTRENFIKIMKKMGASPNSNIFDHHPEIVDHLILLMKKFNKGAMMIHKIEKYNRENVQIAKDKLYFLIGRYGMANGKEFIDIMEDAKFTYKIIDNAGHGINHDQPEIVNQEIIQFLLG